MYTSAVSTSIVSTPGVHGVHSLFNHSQLIPPRRWKPTRFRMLESGNVGKNPQSDQNSLTIAPVVTSRYSPMLPNPTLMGMYGPRRTHSPMIINHPKVSRAPTSITKTPISLLHCCIPAITTAGPRVIHSQQ